MPQIRLRPSTVFVSVLTVMLVVAGVLSFASSVYVGGFLALSFALVSLAVVWVLTSVDGPESF